MKALLAVYDKTDLDYIGRDFRFQANLNQMSNESFLNSIDYQFNYFSHNYGRQETMLSSLFNFDIEKALKTYSFSLSFNMINTSMNADWSSVNPDGIDLNSQVSTAVYLDQLVDVVVINITFLKMIFVINI